MRMSKVFERSNKKAQSLEYIGNHCNSMIEIQFICKFSSEIN